MIDSETEKSRLEEVASWYRNSDDENAYYIDVNFRSIAAALHGTNCLELGSADGNMTGHLLARFDRVTSVEGSELYCKMVREKFADKPNFTAICSLFEEFEPTDRFDTIVASGILEHLDDPGDLLNRAKKWLAPGGRMIAVVPNANSIHRLVGVELGLLDTPSALNNRDHNMGHRRVYDDESLKREFLDAGWKVVATGGSAVKPLSDSQMADWSTEVQDALLAVGQKYLPHFASTIFAVGEL